MAAWVGWLHLPGHPPWRTLEKFDFVPADTASSNSAGDDPCDNSSEATETSSDCPAWSQEGMIHWLYDRCERRLEKTVRSQDPMKTNQYLARQGILSDMLALLEVATTETREQVQQVLEDITDLSSDEDSPTVNTGGHQVAMNLRLSTTIATAFVHGVATMNLCGCDMVNSKSSEGGFFHNTCADLVDNGAWGIHVVLASQANHASAFPSNRLFSSNRSCRARGARGSSDWAHAVGSFEEDQREARTSSKAGK